MKKKTKEANAARTLRKNGESIREIARTLKVSQSSVSLWVKNVELTTKQKAVLLLRRNDNIGRKKGNKVVKEQAQRLRQDWQEQGKRDAQRQDSTHIKACMLYWAEGSKSKNWARMSNTDVNVLKVFVSCLTDFFNVPKDRIKLRIRGYEANGISIIGLRRFWAETLDLPKDNIRQVKMDCDKRVRSGKRRNIHPYGICEVNVSSTEIVQRIFGAIQKYGGFQNTDWLW